MPTATLSMTRDGAYIVVGFGSRFLPNQPPIALPEEFAQFGAKDLCHRPLQGGSEGWGRVGMRLAKNEFGPDVLTMMVAADWLRDQGWEVKPLGWCKTVFDRVHGVAPAA